MGDEEEIHRLLTEMITSHRTPEEVCPDRPDLLPELRRRWRRVRATVEQLDGLFPASDSAGAGASAPDSEPELPFIPGYAVQSILGHGGMGVVYGARHLALDRPVALKMVLAGAFASAPERQRLLREAQAVAALRHPNIVTVFDVGECEGRPFFTMELVEGRNLAQRLAGAPQSAREAADLVATLADAVHSAHEAGIVHRDLKPANVLVTRNGTPKITDFGLARHFEGEPSQTMTGLKVGTPSYMAPEQASGRPDALGPSVDIYSLGALLYEVLTGRPPFRGETALETQRQVIEDEPAPPSRLNSKVPRDLETICLKCLEKEPKRRYATALDLAEDLKRFARGEPIAARRIGPLGRAAKWCRRRPAQALLLAAISLATLMTLVAAVWWSGRQAAGALAIERDLAELAQRQRESDWPGARTALERAKAREFASAALGERIAQAQRDLDLVKELDDIRLYRAVIVGFRFDRQANNEQADEAYAAAFRSEQNGVPQKSPASVAARIQPSAVAPALIAALDDWAVCTADDARRAWILDVARRADVDATEWRKAVRDPASWTDRAALDKLVQSAAVETESVQLLTALAERVRDGGGDAVALLRRVQAGHPGDFWASLALGDALVNAARFGEAVRYYQSALALRPRDAVVYNNLAVALAQDNRIDEAMDHLQVAIRMSPMFAHAHSSLGLCLKMKKRFAEALDLHLEAVRLDPGSASAHANLGIALEDVGRIEDAIAEFQTAIRLSPRNPRARSNLGRLLAQVGRSAEAIDSYRQAIRLAPDNANTHMSLGRTLTRERRFGEALEAFTTAVRLRPDDADLHADRGVALTYLGRLDEALESYRHMLALDPSATDSNEYLRSLLIEGGRVMEVCDLWQKTVAANPPKFDARDGYAELCLFLERVDDYRRECTVLINRFGSSATAQVAERIASACLLAPVSDADAEALSAIVERVRPEAIFVRGLLEYRRNRFDAAEPLLKQAQSREPVATVGTTPAILLALIAHHRGDDRLARKRLAGAIPAVDWRAASASNLAGWTWHVLRREAEAAILPNWPAFLAGTYRPQDNDERLALVGVCQFKNLHHLVAGLYADAFDADPSLADDRRNGYRYNAVCYALWVAGDDGKNAVRLSDEERAKWRAKALQWLKDELARWRTAASGSVQEKNVVRERLTNWRKDPDLAGLRDSEPLARLSELERRECLALWADVDAVLRSLEERP